MAKKLLSRWLLFLPLLGLLGCEKRFPDPAKPTPSPTAPATRQVRIVVGAGYNLSNARAFSSADSIGLNQADVQIAMRQREVASLLFLDKTSRQVIAVVRVDSLQQMVEVNATTVSTGLLDLLPCYPALSPQQRAAVDREVPATQVFRDFATTVESLLRNGQPIYSSGPAYVRQLLALNRHVLATYLNNPLPTSGTGRRSAGVEDFTTWINNVNGATLKNQVHSYTKATFTPIRTGTPANLMLDPQPLVGSWTTTPLTAVPDNAYTLRLDQGAGDVKSRNILALTTKVTGLFMGIIAGYAGGGTDRNECIAAIALNLNASVATALVGAGNSTSEEILQEAVRTVRGGIVEAATNIHCQRLILSRSVLAQAIAARANVLLQALSVANAAFDFVELLPYAKAIVFPLDQSEVMQFYQGRHLPAVVQMERDGSLNPVSAPYNAGQTIYPSIRMVPQSYYATWVKSSFRVDWTVESGSGSVNTATSVTGNDGKATVGWRLPTNYSGNVALVAELKDREGDHLPGSPLRFETAVTNVDSTAIYTAAMLGEWSVQHFSNNPTTTSRMVLNANGSGYYGPATGGTQYSNRWRISRTPSGYFYSETGFWHPAYDGFAHSRLRLPMRSFKGWDQANPNFIAFIYNKM